MLNMEEQFMIRHLHSEGLNVSEISRQVKPAMTKKPSASISWLMELNKDRNANHEEAFSTPSIQEPHKTTIGLKGRKR